MRRAHKTLKIKYGATFEEVKQAYKKQAMQWHPDRFPADDEELQKQATQNFHKITEAYKRLETWHANKEQGKYDAHQPDYAAPEGDRSTSDEDWVDDVTRDLPQFITRTWRNGDKYEGMAISERMHGQGIFTYANGSVYSGQFKYGNMDGLGKFTFSNGDVYSGGAERLPSEIKPWLGDSIGRWEGETLVVETTQFNPGQDFRGSLRHRLLMSPSSKVVERFTRVGEKEILYEFSVEDPEVFTQVWRGEIPFLAAEGQIYEYACHEGNYSLSGILAGARKED